MVQQERIAAVHEIITWYLQVRRSPVRSQFFLISLTLAFIAVVEVA